MWGKLIVCIILFISAQQLLQISDISISLILLVRMCTDRLGNRPFFHFSFWRKILMFCASSDPLPSNSFPFNFCLQYSIIYPFLTLESPPVFHLQFPPTIFLSTFSCLLIFHPHISSHLLFSLQNVSYFQSLTTFYSFSFVLF